MFNPVQQLNPLKHVTKTVNKVIGVVDQFVTDKDLKNEIERDLELMHQQVYLQELATKTVPWVDALHKMGRQIISLISIGAGVYILYNKPDVDPLAVAAIFTPGGLYNFAKGRGK